VQDFGEAQDITPVIFAKYYAAHIKTSLDAAAINVLRPKKNKRGKKAIQHSGSNTTSR
jgi:hypothetical protein